MKNLAKIIEKYSKIEYNSNNYSIGGGLDSDKFASNRHEEALSDGGKLTLGKANQLFSKATGLTVEAVKEILHYAVPNMEWHHAGLLPKSYGGGMKKTYFLNASEIVYVAKNWQSLVNKLSISKNNERLRQETEKTRDQIRLEFLKQNAVLVTRSSERYKFFYETEREMNGKYGWFSSYGKSYNMLEYVTGWVFTNEENYNEFKKL